MGAEVDKPLSPMEQFQDNLKKQLRDDIARMLPDEAVKEMIARVVQEEFFAKRKVRVGGTDWSPVMAEKGTAFQDMVMKAAQPILEKLATSWVDANQQALMENWKRIVDEGLMSYVEQLQRARANTQVAAALGTMLQKINDERLKAGLSTIVINI